jgi:hypothetical protein
LLAIRNLGSSISVQGNQVAWDGRKSHSGLIHFLLEQIERVLSTGCMEWTNAEGLQSARIEPDPDLSWRTDGSLLNHIS